MPFALELSDNIDLTALATFVLALLTLAALMIGWRALLQTRSEIELSRQEVEEAHRPVLVGAPLSFPGLAATRGG